MMNASIETQALAQEWAEDPEAMSEERREALLGWVRERLDSDPEKDPDVRIIGTAVRLHLDLGIRYRETRALCEEAGLPS